MQQVRVIKDGDRNVLRGEESVEKMGGVHSETDK